MLQSKHWRLLMGSMFLCFGNLIAQSDYIPLGHKQYQLIDRLDIKLRNDSVLGFTTMKMYERRSVTQRVAYIDSLDKLGIAPIPLSTIDRHNIQRLLASNREWTSNYNAYNSRKNLWGTFFKSHGNMFEVHTNDFHLAVNPVLGIQMGNANDGTGSTFVNTRGISVRGNIAGKLGFYTYLTDNQERQPLYVRQFVQKFTAVPGAAFYKSQENNTVDYFDARGGITFSAVNNKLNMMFAYDKLHLGNGIRSLFLSDFGAPYLFFKLKTRVWRFDYENVFTEMTATFRKTGTDRLLPKKYMTAHHISFNVAKWLNIGLYENVVFGRANGFELQYLNPVIFYRAIEGNLGSPDKATVGIDFKSNINKNVQLYGQLVINEFVFDAIKKYREGSWLNKHAAQLGFKYIDVAGISNLDLQVEYNWIRPFTYTHRDSITSFTHYNQPLAHPLGASVREIIAQLRYQPTPKLYLNAQLMMYKQGTDVNGRNYGSNIFLSYNTRARNDNLFVGSERAGNCTFIDIHAAYEILENMFIDASATQRNYKLDGGAAQNVFFFNLGVRANLARRSILL